MAITSVSLAGVQILDGQKYAAAAQMAYVLDSMPTWEAQAVEMAHRHPFYVRDQIQPKMIPIVIWLLEPTLAAREAAFNALVTAAMTPDALVTLTWVNGGSRTLDVKVQELIAGAYYSRMSGEAIAFNPIPR